MGKAGTPSAVMLFCSVMFHDDAQAARALALLTEKFGPISYQSVKMPFDYTAYYCREMDSPLYRYVVAFEKLVPRDHLAPAKTYSNAIEDRLSSAGLRKVNLDPGILSMENISLATTKPYSHRIYLSDGIWAEVTLMYQGNAYHPLEWTYPDYASEEMVTIFKKLRATYKEKIQCQEV